MIDLQNLEALNNSTQYIKYISIIRKNMYFLFKNS
jgi:hypothetical protein